MQDGIHDAASAARLAVRCIYAIAGLIWLGALAFALYRYHQIRTLTPVMAEVLKAETESYTSRTTATDSDGFTTDAEFKGYVPVVWVRYEFNGKTYTVEARYDTGSSFRWIQDRITRRWKPGSRIRVHIDPAKPDKPLPDLGLNLHTFQVSIVLVITGFFFVGLGYGMDRLGAYAWRLFDQLKQTPGR